jgi:hypothetical protein
MAAQTHARAHVSTTRCGNKYTPACTAPHISHSPISGKCVSGGSTYTLPNLRFTSNAGIRKIQIREGSRTLKVIKFKGQGPTQYTLKSLAITTLRLAAGGHPITVKITDVKGRSVSKSISFSVCEATPKITNTPLSAKCVPGGTGYTLPKLTFTSNPGIKTIQILEGSRTIKSLSFGGQGKTEYPLSGLHISTVGLSAGGHALTVKVTDIKGKSSTKTLRFAVCAATPVFTG